MVPFCWQVNPSGGGQTGWAPSTQVGVHAAADVVVVGGRQIEGVTVTVTVDAEQVFVSLVEVVHVFVLGDDVGVILCEVALPGEVDDAVVLGTLTVVLQYISSTIQHSFSCEYSLTDGGTPMQML